MDAKKRNKFQNEVSHLLVKAREEKGLTQKMVASMKIVSQSELSKIENNQRNIDFLVLIELTFLYEKNITDFIPKEFKK